MNYKIKRTIHNISKYDNNLYLIQNILWFRGAMNYIFLGFKKWHFTFAGIKINYWQERIVINYNKYSLEFLYIYTIYLLTI